MGNEVRYTVEFGDNTLSVLNALLESMKEIVELGEKDNSYH